MGLENNLARFMRNTGPVRFFLPFGVILIIMGVLLLVHMPKEYHETTGKVISTTQDVDAEGSVTYSVEFEFTVDNKSYTNVFVGEKEEPKAGDPIQVFYDPENPNTVSNSKGTGIIAPIMIVVGVLMAGFSIYKSAKYFKRDRELDEIRKTNAGTIIPVEPLPKEQLTEYYVSFDGKTLTPGYIVEDQARNKVYEMTMTKNSLVANRIFTFTNVKTGATTTHEVGHTMTQTYNDEFFSTTSSFKFDGKNVWEVIHERGIRISTDLHSIFPRVIYTLSLNGRFAATVETASKNVHEEDEAEHKVNIPVGRYYFRVWTNETDLDPIFLTVFAISETEQAVVE